MLSNGDIEHVAEAREHPEILPFAVVGDVVDGVMVAQGPVRREGVAPQLAAAGLEEGFFRSRHGAS